MQEDMENIDICKLCFETFGGERRPRVLHCGHSYCTCCLDKLIANGNLSCPKCKKNHNVESARNFAINYDLEESLSCKRMAQAQGASNVQLGTKRIKIGSFISEQKAGVHNIVHAAKDMQSQLKGYDEFLVKEYTKHEKALGDLTQLHQGLMEEIKEERKKITNIQNEVHGYSNNVNDKLPDLVQATSDTAAASVVAGLVGCLGGLEGLIERCQQEFPWQNVTFSQQVLTRSMDAFSLSISRREKHVPLVSDPSKDDFTILEQVAKLRNDATLTVDRLRGTPQEWKHQIASGRVYAIHSTEGGKRSAKLSMQEGKIYLHHLQDREEPAFTRTIKHSEIVNSLDTAATVAFLDLAWDSLKGRVHILLSPDTPLARNFRILCTGDLGPSYAHSKFHEVVNSRKLEEAIRGGDYQWSNGSGGAPVMEGLNTRETVYQRVNETGLVFTTPHTTDSQSAQFSITTGPTLSVCRVINVFGQVQDGIDVLQAAAKCGNIKKVEIIDCGVVLPY